MSEKKEFKTNSLLTRSIVLLISIVVLPLLLTLVLNIETVREQTELQVRSEVRALVELRLNMLNFWLQNRTDAISELALRPEVVSTVVAYHNGVAENKDVIALHNSFSSQVYKQAGSFSETTVVDADSGDVITSTRPTLIDQNLRDNPLFVEGQSHLYFGDIVRDGSNKVHLTMSTPIVDVRHGETVGILITKSDLSDIVPVIRSLSGLGVYGDVYMVNEDSHWITPSRYDSHVVLRERNLSKPSLMAAGGESGTVKYERGGEKYIAAYSWNPLVRWGMVVEVNEREAMAPTNTLLSVLQYSLLGITALIFLYVYAVGYRSILRPIAHMRDVLDRLSHDDLTARVNVTTHDEIGLLGKSVNDMADEIASTRSGLELHVYERTKDLENIKRSLEDKIRELEQFQRITIDRELRMVELKKDLKKLKNDHTKDQSE